MLLGEVVEALEVMERDFLAMVRKDLRRAVRGGSARASGDGLGAGLWYCTGEQVADVRVGWCCKVN